MKIKRILLAVPAMALVAACTVEQPMEQPSVPEVETVEVPDSPSTISGVVNVQFTEEMADYIASQLGADRADGEAMTKAFTDTKAEALSGLMAELGIESMERIFPDAGKWEPRHRAAGLHTWYRVKYDENVTHTRAASSLEEISFVSEVEIPRVTKAASIPFNDSYKSYQWNLFNDGKGTGFKKGIDINVVPVWEQFTTGSSDVIVAVVDNGINIHHEELEGVVIPGTEDGGSRSFVYGYEGPELSADGHGTHVSGIIAALNNNKKGISSIAGGSDGTGGVRILGCQMMKENGDKTLQGNSAEAIVWGADHGAVISQNSWGYSYDDYSSAASGKINSSDKAAIDYFIANAGFDENGNQVGPMAGGVVFFAAANDAWDAGWPAAYEGVIAVGAISPDGKRTSYSNYGEWVDICAPGGEFEGKFANNSDAMILSSAYDSYYFMAGTSQACPHVSGVAALLVSYYGGPGFTNNDLLDKLIYGANYYAPSKDELVGPMLDAYGAFTAESISDPVITSDHPGDIVLKSHESLTVNYKIEGTDRIPLKVSFSEGSKAVTGELKDDTFVVNFRALNANPGTYKATLTASYGPNRTTTEEINYTILENHAPVLVKPISSTIVEGKSETLTLDMTQYINDEDGEILQYTYEFSPASIADASASGNVVTIKPKAFGSTIVTITGTDARGKACTAQPFTFLVYDTAQGFSAYPVPVVDKLNLCAGKTKDMKVVITSAAGGTVYDGTVTGDSFSPAVIDMKSCAPGNYALSVAFNGETYTRNIVKK